MMSHTANHVLYTGHLAFLEASFCACVREQKARDPLCEVWVIVPNQLTRLHLRRTLAHELGIAANVRFMTVTDLMHALAEPVVLRDGWKTLGESVLDPLLADMIARVKNRLTYLAPVADSAGFRRALMRTRQELIYHRIAPELLKKVLFAAKERAQKIDDLILLLNAITQELERLKLHDAAHLQALALNAMSESAPRNVPIFTYALCELDPLTQAVFEELQSLDDMSVFLPCVPESAAYDYTSPLRMWYLDLGFTEIFEETPATDYPPIRFVSAPHDVAVATEIVRDVLHDERLSAGDAAVLLPGNSRALTDVLESRCHSAGLAPYIYQARTLGATPAGRGLAALAKLLDSEFTLAQVKTFLSSAPFVEDFAARAGEWIRLAEESLIIAGEADWHKRLEQKLAQLVRREERRAEAPDTDDHSLTVLRRRIENVRALQEFMRALIAVIHSARSEASWEAGVRVLWEFYTGNIVMGEEFADLTLQLDQAALPDRADVPVTPEGLREFILATLETPGQRIGSFSSGTPIVAPREQSIGASFPHVFLPGFNEGTLPHAERQDPLLLDRDREDINNELHTALPLSRDWQARERFLLEMQLRSATESIAVYIARADADGRPQLLSPYVTELLATQHGAARGSDDIESLLAQPPHRYVAAHPLEACDLEHAISQSEYHRLALGQSLKTREPLLSYLQENVAFRSALELESSRFRSSKFTRYDGRLERASLLKHFAARYSPENAIDASALEDYWKCPFRYAATREWEAYTPEELDPLNPITPLDRGSLYHNILQRYHGAQLNQPMSSEHYTLGALREVALSELHKFARNNPVGPQYAVQKFEREVLSVLKHYYDEELNNGAWRTRYVETRFGFGDGEFPDPAQYASAEGQFIRFRGRIDRWDSDDSGTQIRITDYKTGEKPNSKSRASQRRLQLAIYHHVAKSRFSEASVSPRYLYLKSSGEDAQVDDVARQRILEESVNLLSDLRAGVFVPDPALDDSAVCKNCAVKLACGAQRHTEKRIAESSITGIKTSRAANDDGSEGDDE